MNIEKKIRKMEFSDLDEVLKIEQELFSEAWNSAMFEEEIRKQISYLIEVSGKIAGYICGWKMYREFNITNVAVAKEFQKKGIGKVLVDFVLENIAKDNFQIVFLEVRESNLPAIKLYEKCDFIKISKRKKYYKNPVEDAILMIYNLPKKENNER